MGHRKNIINRPTNAKDEQEEMITIGTILSPMEPIIVKHYFGKDCVDYHGANDHPCISLQFDIENDEPHEHTHRLPKEKKVFLKDEDSYND